MKYTTAKPRDFITDYDLLVGLKRYALIKQKAILFALTSGLRPDEIEVLDWSVIRYYTFTPGAIGILKSLPRHLFSNLVFWEDFEGTPIMLNNLRDDCENLSAPYEWGHFVALAKDIVLVNESANLFIRTLTQEILTRQLAQ